MIWMPKETSHAYVPGCGMYEYESEDLLVAIKRFTTMSHSLLNNREGIINYMIHYGGLWDGSEVNDTDTLAEVFDHAVHALAWQFYSTRKAHNA
jgi:hypothetical protein